MGEFKGEQLRRTQALIDTIQGKKNDTTPKTDSEPDQQLSCALQDASTVIWEVVTCFFEKEPSKITNSDLEDGEVKLYDAWKIYLKYYPTLKYPINC